MCEWSVAERGNEAGDVAMCDGLGWVRCAGVIALGESDIGERLRMRDDGDAPKEFVCGVDERPVVRTVGERDRVRPERLISGLLRGETSCDQRHRQVSDGRDGVTRFWKRTNVPGEGEGGVEEIEVRCRRGEWRFDRFGDEEIARDSKRERIGGDEFRVPPPTPASDRREVWRGAKPPACDWGDRRRVTGAEELKDESDCDERFSGRVRGGRMMSFDVRRRMES
ncbi:hypothetical protein Tco_0436477 [Tanacetum coccineum]